MKGVILAGGKGTRLRPLTNVANKHLLPIYNRPMVEYPLDTLKSLGITDILIVTGGEYIGRFAELLGDGSKYGVMLTYRVQESANGIAGALALAEGFAGGEDITVILGDNIFDNGAIPKEVILPAGMDVNCAFVYGKTIDDPTRFGVPAFHRDGRIKRIDEKPKDPASRYAITGLYRYPSTVFNMIRTLEPSARGELEITDVNNAYIEQGKLHMVELGGFWSDAGTIDSLLECANWAKQKWEDKLNEPVPLTDYSKDEQYERKSN